MSLRRSPRFARSQAKRRTPTKPQKREEEEEEEEPSWSSEQVEDVEEEDESSKKQLYVVLASSVPAAVADTHASTWQRKLLVRCSVGLVMIACFFALVFSNHWVVSAFILAVQAMSFKEMTSIRFKEAKEKAIPLFRFLNWFAFLLAQWLVYGKRVLVALGYANLVVYHMSFCFGGWAVFFLTFVLSLKKGFYKYQMMQLAWSTLVISLVVGQAVGSLWNIFQGIFWFMLPSSLIVCNDIMAYFSGLAFGRRFIKRQFLALSPNKTWEGFLGGFVSTVIICPLMVYLYSQVDYWVCPPAIMNATYSCVRPDLFLAQEYAVRGYSFTVAPVYLHGFVLAVFASLIAPFGGFFASGVKRAFNKKDFDSIFPGHGGVFDRLDCQMITQLFTYVYLRSWVIPSSVTASQVIALATALSIAERLEVLAALQKLVQQ